MSRKWVLLLGIGVVGLALLLPLGGASAGVSNLRLSNNTCSGATATVAFDGAAGAPTPNTIRFTAFQVSGGGDVTLPGEVTVAAPGAVQDVTATLSFGAQTQGTTIRVRASQLNNSGGTVASIDTTYTCSGAGVTPTPTPSPTPIDARERERQQGIERLYNGLGDAVIYKMPNSDIQFYRLQNNQGIWVGTAPYTVMDQMLYQPNQLVGQYQASDNWRVDLYYHGWDVWRAVYYTPSGAVHTDVYFHFGNPNAGLPPVETGGAGAVAGQGGFVPPQGFIPPGNLPRIYPPSEPVSPPSLVVVQPPAPQLVAPPPAVIVPVPEAPVASSVQIPAGGLPVVAQFSVNLRTAPSLDAPRLTALAQGTPLTLIGRDRTGYWVLGRLANGIQGWAAMQYLSANLAQVRALPVVQ